MATNEERLQDTIQSVQDEEYRSIRQAALSNGVARSTVGVCLGAAPFDTPFVPTPHSYKRNIVIPPIS
jgi:hypothetical protein